MSNLYQLTNEVEQLDRDLWNSLDEETGELDEEIANALNVAEAEFDKKAVAVATVSRRFSARVSEIKAEIERLTVMKKRAEAIEERLKNSLSEACQRLGKVKIDGIGARISFRTSEKTVIDNEEALPKEFMKETITYKPDLTKIKESIKAGQTVSGAHIEECQNIQIK